HHRVDRGSGSVATDTVRAYGPPLQEKDGTPPSGNGSRRAQGYQRERASAPGSSLTHRRFSEPPLNDLLAPRHRPAHFAVGFRFAFRLALVMHLLAASDGQLDLCATVFE